LHASDPELSLDDLRRWSVPGTPLAVLGHPIRHSLSPVMHNAALAALARDQPEFASWRYHKFAIAPDDLPRALDLFHLRGFAGLNLTVPHKVIAFDRVRAIGPVVPLIGAVNTLRRTGASGEWEGHNTDGYGLSSGVREDLGFALCGLPVILLGAGGAARAAAVECLQPDRRCASLWIANRTRSRLDGLLAALRPLAGPDVVQPFDPTKPPAGLPAGALVINATAAGLRPDDPLPVDLARLPRPAGIYDMIYNPPRTRLLQEASARGLPNANGLSMLVHQGAKSLEIWSGVPAERTAPAMGRAARAALGLAG
jgi:shikimate dehydrogenase